MGPGRALAVSPVINNDPEKFPCPGTREMNNLGDGNPITVSSTCTAAVKAGHYTFTANVKADVPAPSKNMYQPALEGSIVIQYAKFAIVK
jgi:hypothetical protein